jgi:methyltransferase (TIGR00027 family)
MATALMRATHTRADSPVLIEDPWGDRLVLDEERAQMLARTGAEDLDALLRAHPSYGTVIVRARYAEDALAEAVARGVRQYVLIGAGMDSFALRRPAFARDLEIFEIDHPSTQELKSARLALCAIAPPPNLHLLAVDLGATALDAALADSPFRSDRPAFFSWLGVTSYLTRAANLATLAAIARSALPGSELVFSYLDQRLFDSADEHGAMQRARAQVAAVGEPWMSGFDPDELAQQLHSAGLELLENLTPDDLLARYCEGRSDGLTPSRGSHLARARVAR